MLMLSLVAALAVAAGTGAQAPSSAQPPAGQENSAAKPSASSDGGFANETEKGSYAVGYNFGQIVQSRKMDVVAEQLIAGLRDALRGGPARISESEVVTLARHVQNEGMRRLQKERAEQSARNRAEGQAFLETNKKRSGVVSLPSGLQYEVLRAGSGAKPAADDAVKVHFRGTLMDGTVFDSSFDRGQPIVVRPDTTIPAWIEALPNMSVGAKWKLFVPADLGYGDRPAENIPPGSTLIFEVELLSIEPKGEQKAPGSDESPGQ